MTIRRATEADEAALRGLWEEFEREVPTRIEEPEPWADEWADTLDDIRGGGVFLAEDDQGPVAVARIEAPVRGRALGPGYVRGTLAPGAARRMDQLFLSGQAATVAADSRPQKHLRLKIFDGAGKLVCDRSPAHVRDCRFTPVFTQRYRIEIANGGAATAHYYLVVD